jgi:uncharacterized membrane protein (UPF0182 family)
MSRDLNDIPEVFRRAWLGEDSGGGGGPVVTPRRGTPLWRRRWFWLAALAFGFWLSWDWLVTTYTEWLWFGGLGYQSVWLRQWGLQVAAFAVLFVLAAAILLLNWHAARARSVRPVLFGAQLWEIPYLSALVTAAALFMAFLFGTGGASQWRTFLRYVYRVPYGEADPVFGLDISFYLFELPVYRFVQGWLMPLLVVALLGALVFYGAALLRFGAEGRVEIQEVPPHVRRHVALLAALFFTLWAVGYWMDSYSLLFSPSGVVFGAGYTDLHATLPALRVQMVLMALVALAFLVNVFRNALRLPLYAGGLWLLATLVGGLLVPGIMQSYLVEPNELARETPYIENNIRLTRMAFGLDKIATQPFTDVTVLSEQDLEENDVALGNIRLWDYRPLYDAYQQLQALRPYYHFTPIDVDRYEIEGETRQVMLAARELNKAGLQSPSWVNQRLEFTHGYGIAMNPVDRVSEQGRPEFFIQDLPPTSTVDLEITRPELYFGETTNDVVYVNSTLAEFDYPMDDDSVYSNYEGTGGVPISSWLERFAFTSRFGDTNLILSDYITPETRVLFHRQISERIRQITPFLTLDSDPYIVVADGRLVWMVDAYTVSGDFPYATPLGTPDGEQFNYIRNAVKVTVDAYEGDVAYYLADPSDPLIQTYARAFPGLFRPMDEMPDALRAHIRYPEDYFEAQTRQYLQYHMTNVQIFYNQEDLWAIPQETFGDNQQPMEPYYVMFRLPGEEETEYLLIQPYTPASRNNMVAWLAARSDPEQYGELVAYELPRQELVFGPSQVEARINQDPQISEQLTLWNQQGSNVIRGNLIVIPLNNSFLYVEPLYLQAESSAIPELQRVIVASGETVVMRETLAEALAALIEDAPAVDTIVAEPPVGGDEEVEGTVDAVPPSADDATVEELIRSANAHFEAAQAAQRDGDWAAYGREQEALERDLQRLVELTGEALPDATPEAVEP